MSWKGEIVIDLDSHIVERADRFYDDYLDPGYRAAYRQLCEAAVRIPMVGAATSLNLGVAASIVFFEALRQRRATPGRPASHAGST